MDEQKIVSKICWQMVWKLAKLQNLQSCPKKKLLRLRK